MSLLEIKVDVDGPMRGLAELAADQLPFVLARTLTQTAKDAQSAVRLLERGVFQLRNDWTVRNTKITPATKEKLAAEVYTDTENRQTGAPDYLNPQSEGALKVPHEGHHYLAVPTRYLYRYTPRNRPLPDNLRPAALLPAGAKEATEYAGTFNGGRNNGEKRAISGRTLKKLRSGDFVAFLQRAKSGTLCIFVRHGGVAGQAGHDAEPWYTLVTSARIVARFPMGDIVEQVVKMNFPENFGRAIAETRINEALRPAGLSITI